MTIATETKTIATVTVKVDFVKDFLRFLDERKALLPWLENVSKFGPEGIFQTIKEKSPINWLKAAFTWSNTEQGGSYWNELDEEWMHYLFSDVDLAKEKAKKEYGPNTILSEKVQFKGE